SEARIWRNDWSHNRHISDPDTDRALDTVERLLNFIDAPGATEVGVSRAEMRRSQAEVELRRGRDAEESQLGGSGPKSETGAGSDEAPMDTTGVDDTPENWRLILTAGR